MSAKRPDPGMMARVNRLRSCALGRSAWQWVPGRAVMVDEVRWRAAVLRVRTMLEVLGSHMQKSLSYPWLALHRPWLHSMDAHMRKA